MRLLLALALLLFFSDLSAQNESSKPNLFLDCQMRCDRIYLKEEITYVNYVRDRQVSDIYVLATRQNTGAGGNEIRLAFSGSNEYSAITDTIIYYVEPQSTDAVWREALVENMKKGLLPFLAISPIADKITYNIEMGDEDETEEEVNDPWNYWVFNLGGNLWVNGEDQFSGINLGTRFNVSRVTEDHKFWLNLRYNLDKSTFVLSDGEEFKNTQKSYNINSQYVKSLGDHLSAGFRTGAGSSTFGNTDFDARFNAAVEYNVFPYSESSTKRFTFFYNIGALYNNYTDTTVYNKLTETVMQHGIEIEFRQVEKWGEVEIEIGADQYLHDLSLYSLYLNPEIEWNITKGLYFNLGGFISFVGDRINIAKSDITDEDILLQTKQLDTDYRYFSYMGINYRFGSQYNNFVNTRF